MVDISSNLQRDIAQLSGAVDKLTGSVRTAADTIGNMNRTGEDSEKTWNFINQQMEISAKFMEQQRQKAEKDEKIRETKAKKQEKDLEDHNKAIAEFNKKSYSERRKEVQEQVKAAKDKQKRDEEELKMAKMLGRLSLEEIRKREQAIRVTENEIKSKKNYLKETNAISKAASKIGEQMAEIQKSSIGRIMTKFFSMLSGVLGGATLAAGVIKVLKLSDSTFTNIAKAAGTTTSESGILLENYKAAAGALTRMGISIEAQTQLTRDSIKEFKGIGGATTEILTNLGAWTVAFGMSSGEAAKALKDLTVGMTITTKEAFAFAGALRNEAASAGLETSLIMRDVANYAASLTGSIRETPEKLKQAAIRAAMLGTALSEQPDLSKRYQTLESSIKDTQMAGMHLNTRLDAVHMTRLARMGKETELREYMQKQMAHIFDSEGRILEQYRQHPEILEMIYGIRGKDVETQEANARKLQKIQNAGVDAELQGLVLQQLKDKRVAELSKKEIQSKVAAARKMHEAIQQQEELTKQAEKMQPIFDQITNDFKAELMPILMDIGEQFMEVMGNTDGIKKEIQAFAAELKAILPQGEGLKDIFENIKSAILTFAKVLTWAFENPGLAALAAVVGYGVVRKTVQLGANRANAMWVRMSDSGAGMIDGIKKLLDRRKNINSPAKVTGGAPFLKDPNVKNLPTIQLPPKTANVIGNAPVMNPSLTAAPTPKLPTTVPAVASTTSVKAGSKAGSVAGGVIGWITKTLKSAPSKLMGGLKTIFSGVLSKGFLKKIPFLGLFFSLFDMVTRFQRGDYVGAALEFIAAVASLFPGVGTGIGIAISGANVLRDMKSGGAGVITESMDAAQGAAGNALGGLWEGGLSILGFAKGGRIGRKGRGRRVPKSGKRVDKPTLAVIGEENRDEIIIPTERLRKGLPVDKEVAKELESIPSLQDQPVITASTGFSSAAAMGFSVGGRSGNQVNTAALEKSLEKAATALETSSSDFISSERRLSRSIVHTTAMQEKQANLQVQIQKEELKRERNKFKVDNDLLALIGRHMVATEEFSNNNADILNEWGTLGKSLVRNAELIGDVGRFLQSNDKKAALQQIAMEQMKQKLQESFGDTKFGQLGITIISSMEQGMSLGSATLLAASQVFKDNVVGQFAGGVQQFMSAGASFKDSVKQQLKAMTMQKAITKITEMIKNKEITWDKIKMAWEQRKMIWEKIKKAFEEKKWLMDKARYILDKIKLAWEKIKLLWEQKKMIFEIFKMAWEKIMLAKKAIAEGAGNALGMITSFIPALVGFITTFFTTVLIPVITAVGSFIAGLLAVIWPLLLVVAAILLIIKFWPQIKKVLKAIPKFIVKYFKFMFKVYSKIFKFLVKAIKLYFKTLIRVITWIIKTAFKAFTFLPRKIWGIFKKILGIFKKLNPMNWFSEGGVVDKPTMSMIGETGEKEVIVPVDRIKNGGKVNPAVMTELSQLGPYLGVPAAAGDTSGGGGSGSSDALLSEIRALRADIAMLAERPISITMDGKKVADVVSDRFQRMASGY